MYYLEIVLFCLYLSNCALVNADGSRQRIIGGAKATIESGKFHASLQNLTGHHVCGGAIISPSHITTAAHCVYGAEPQYIQVVVGTIDLDVGGVPYHIQSIHIHPLYNRTLRLNDIAVLQIKGHYDLNQIEILQIDEKDVEENDNVLLVGFGAQEPNGESSRQMLALNLTVFSQETCCYAMRYTREVFESMFCTFTKKGQGTCHGDSGGPLTKDNRLVGLVSWGIPCGIGFPDVHTRIAPYVGWIKKVVEETTPKKNDALVNIKVNVKVSV